MRHPLYSIGHSNQPLEQFIALLTTHDVAALVDIRRFPGSRKYPHWNREPFAQSLRGAGIEYHWNEGLGGRRGSSRGNPDSSNGALRNVSFRNYADYMATDAFRVALEELGAIADRVPTAMMCSEAVFWRCHRRLVSDYLLAQGTVVQHIFPNGTVRPHDLTEGAQVADGRVTYPEAATPFTSS
jgi:uncharacterized protein (DUF488 family)